MIERAQRQGVAAGHGSASRALKRAALCALLGALTLLQFGAHAQTAVDAGLFWQRGCAHCEAAIAYLAGVEARDPDVRVRYLELGDERNRRAYRAVVEHLGVERLAVPLLIVGDRVQVGFLDDATTGQEIDRLLSDCRREGCVDLLRALDAPYAEDRALALRQIGADRADAAAPPGATPPHQVRLPLLGEVDLRALSLPVLTVVLGAIDGFNPCAMWVLVLLLGLLLGLQDPVRRWVLGLVFLLTTALVYYAMISLWLGALLVLGLMTWLRIAIGVLALGGGAYYVYGYFTASEQICRVAGEARRRRILDGLRGAVTEPRFLSAIGGIAALAVAVNLIELLCSAGIPVVYTQILALTPMPAWQHQAWLALYVFVFLLDDLALFAAAMLTMRLTGGTGRFAHHAQLAGGAVLALLGLLLLFRPEWLRFG